jgi:hypothetical protein
MFLRFSIDSSWALLSSFSLVSQLIWFGLQFVFSRQLNLIQFLRHFRCLVSFVLCLSASLSLSLFFLFYLWSELPKTEFAVQFPLDFYSPFLCVFFSFFIIIITLLSILFIRHECVPNHHKQPDSFPSSSSVSRRA